MSLPTFYYSSLMADHLVVLPQIRLMYLGSDAGTVYVVHKELLEQLEDTMITRRGDISTSERFSSHWLVLSFHFTHTSTVLAFAVWSNQHPQDPSNDLDKIKTLQRYARMRHKGIKAQRTREVLKLAQFKSTMADCLPSELIQHIIHLFFQTKQAQAQRRHPVRIIESAARRARQGSRP